MIKHHLPFCFTLLSAFTMGFLLTGSAQAQTGIDFDSAIFQSSVVTQDDTDGYAITADIREGGIVVGQLEAALTYGTGTNPFDTGDNWGASGGAYSIFAESSSEVVGNDTASGDWEIKVTPNAGWQVDGISIFSQATTLGNPDFMNVTSNGLGSIFDENELITNYTDGQSFTNGGNILFDGGSTPSGIPDADHAKSWAFNAAGATQVNFTYQVGHDEAVASIQIEGIRMDAQLSPIVAVPEPTAATVALLALSGLCLRRRRS